MNCEVAASGKLSRQFKQLFEEQSQLIFNSSKRQANLEGPVVNSWTKALIRVFNGLSETNLYVECKGESKFSSKVVPTRPIKSSNWQLMFRFYLTYVCLKQMFTLALQYKFDFLTVEYEKVGIAHESGAASKPFQPNLIAGETRRTNNQSDWHQPASNKSGSDRLRRIQSQKDYYEHILMNIGAPFIYMSFMGECSLVFIGLTILGYYVSPLILCKTKGPFNISLMRMLIDEEREWQNVNQLILDEIETIIQSSKHNLVRTIESISKFRHNKDHRNVGERKPNTSDCAARETTRFLIQSSVVRHNSVVRLLKRLALGGSLHPPNRMPDWVATLSRKFLLFWVVLVMVDASALTINVVLSEYIFGRKIPTGSMNFISLCEIEFMSVEGLMLLDVWYAIYLYVFIDQFHIVTKLMELLKDCIKTSCRIELQAMSAYSSIFERTQESQIAARAACQHCDLSARVISQSKSVPDVLERGYYYRKHNTNQPESKLEIEPTRPKLYENTARIEQMNENLLRFLTNYRIFVRQFRPLKELFSQMTRYIHVLCVLFPLYVAALVPYMSWRFCILLVGMVWGYMLSYDATLISVCAYQAKSKLLHKRLFTLLAHVDRIQSKNPIEFPVYNPFIVTLFRRAIEYPDLALLRVSITPFRSPVNYIHVFRMHFWAGILTVYALSAYETGTIRFTSEMESGSSIFGLFG